VEGFIMKFKPEPREVFLPMIFNSKWTPFYMFLLSLVFSGIVHLKGPVISDDLWKSFFGVWIGYYVLLIILCGMMTGGQEDAGEKD